MKLDNVLAEIEQEEQEVLFQEAFQVNDLDSAAEAQRRIAWFEDKKKEIEEITKSQIEPFQKRIDKIKSWGEESKQEFIQKQTYYSNLLEQFMKQQIAEQVLNGKKPKKTISLPYGKIALKKQQPEFLKDESTLLNYAEQSGFVKIEKKTDWASIKSSCIVVGDKLYDQNGEEVPGVKVVEREEKFELKLDC